MKAAPVKPTFAAALMSKLRVHELMFRTGVERMPVDRQIVPRQNDACFTLFSEITRQCLHIGIIGYHLERVLNRLSDGTELESLRSDFQDSLARLTSLEADLILQAREGSTTEGAGKPAVAA